MDYEKKYKEFLEKLKELQNDWRSTHNRAADEVDKLLSEFEDNEDESIRKELIKFIKSRGGFKQEYIGWLERQGEHIKFIDSIQIGDQVTRNQDGVLVNLSQLKRVAKKDEKQGEQESAWSKEDDRMKDSIIKELIHPWYSKIPDSTKDEINWLKSLKDRVQPQTKQEWSEEDEKRIDNLCHFLEEYGNQYYGHLTLQDTISWLKSIRPLNRWKPSEEQMIALKIAIEHCDERKFANTNPLLISLYNDLKKLRGE